MLWTCTVAAPRFDGRLSPHKQAARAARLLGPRPRAPRLRVVRARRLRRATTRAWTGNRADQGQRPRRRPRARGARAHARLADRKGAWARIRTRTVPLRAGSVRAQPPARAAPAGPGRRLLQRVEIG